MSFFDIVYSVGCHEHPDGFIDFLRNIFFYNKELSVCVLVNCNEPLYENLSKRMEEFETRVYLLPNPWKKTLFTYDIFETHIQTIEFCDKKNISATYFIPLASNCMFHKMITSEYLSSLPYTPVDITDKTKHPYTVWHWPEFYKNEAVLKILNSDSIYNYQGNLHEGLVLSFDIMKKIEKYVKTKNIKEQINNQVGFEEILFGTLYAYFTGTTPPSFCRIFWGNERYRPSILDIENTNEPCVKRVLRDYDDPVRKWLRERTENYVNNS